MTETPWQRGAWAVDRVKELGWTLLGVPAFLACLSAVSAIYGKIVLDRDVTQLVVMALGFGGYHVGRRVGEQYLAGRGNGEGKPGGGQAGQTPPAGRA